MQPRFTIAAVLACLALAGCSTVQPKSKPKPSSPWVYQTPKPHGAIYRFFHPKSEKTWKGVSPALREKVEAVQAQLAAEGFDVRPVEGYRSPERQAALLASGTVPYVALQLRSVATSYGALANLGDTTRPMIVTAIVLAAFAIGFGTRGDAKERADGGLLAAVAVESLIKLAAFAAVALFALWLVVEAAPVDQPLHQRHDQQRGGKRGHEADRCALNERVPKARWPDPYQRADRADQRGKDQCVDDR